MDPTVVTIYCCGTAFHRDRIDFSVPYTWRATAGDRVWINDGPGNTTHHILKTEKILKKVESSSPQAPSSEQGVLTKMGNAIPNALMNRAFSTHHTSSIKQLTGVGSQDNVVTTLQWLWMEFYRKDKPGFKTINLCGWSRGAVTCIALAHAIEAAGFRTHIPRLKVNIFAFDPVPGGLNDFDKNGDFMKTGRAGTVDTLSNCVNEYNAILAENVGGLKGKVFKCVSPEFTNSSKRGPSKTEYPMPGGHSTVANHRDDNPIGRIAVSLCHDFLTKHGTQLYVNKKLTEAQMIELYADALLEHGEFKKKGFINRRRVFEKSTAAKVRAPLVSNPMRKHPFYVNQHHRELFRKNLHSVYQRIKLGLPIDDADKNMLMTNWGHTYTALQATEYC